jgi:hypothetical protein
MERQCFCIPKEKEVKVNRGDREEKNGRRKR